MRHKTDGYRWFECTGKASFDAQGQPRRMCGSLVDINENRNLRLELEKREALLEEVGAMTLTGGWEIDLYTKQMRCSRELLDIFEVAEDFTPDVEKIMGFYAPEAGPIIRQKVKEALGAGKAWDEELKFITAAQKEIWVRTLGQPIFNDSGDVVGLRGVLQNINDHKQAEQLLQASEEKFRKMFELSPVGMTLTSLDNGSFVEYNRAFLNSTGYTAEELKSVTYKVLTPEEFIPASRQQLDILLKNGVYGPFEVENQAKNGQRYPVLLNGILVDDDKGQKLVWSFFQDISEIKRREQHIAHLNEELKAINSQKDQLFSIISHDLRGSVGSTDVILDMLLGQENIHNGETWEIILKAKQSSVTARALLEELLLWARNQMNKVPFTPVPQEVQRVAAQAFQVIQSQAELKHITMVSDIPEGIQVMADLEMLKVILRNLLSNAVKYSFPGGTITLSVREEAGRVLFAIKDEGVGIKQENLDKLLEQKKHFTTLGTKGEYGSGLGLTLVQEFVRKHGGKITANSQVNKGSTFNFYLPKA
jgi:PAS domain S-box-containing protein